MSLVIGSEGFIGSHLKEELNARGFDRKIGMNALDQDLVKREVFQQDTVFHLANIPSPKFSVSDPHFIVHNNVVTTLNIVEACRIYETKLIYLSSYSVYESNEPPYTEDMQLHPKTPYGTSKLICEEILQNYHERYGVNIVIIRPSNVWGGRDYLHAPIQVLPLWLKLARKGKPISINGKELTRDFTYISDLIEGIKLASELDGFHLMNMSGGKMISMYDVAKKICDEMGVELLIKDSNPNEPKRWWGDISLAKKLTGWEPKVDFWKKFEEYKKERLYG